MIDHKALREALAEASALGKKAEKAARKARKKAKKAAEKAKKVQANSSTGWVAKGQPTLGKKAKKKVQAKKTIPAWITSKAKGAAEHIRTLRLEDFWCFRICHVGPECPACGGGQVHRTSSEGPAPLSLKDISEDERARLVEKGVICFGQQMVQPQARQFKAALIKEGVPESFIKF